MNFEGLSGKILGAVTRTGLHVGLLLNFNSPTLVVKRVVL